MTARVLVADDEADIRLLARFMLRPEGYEVVEAGSGEQCLDVLREGGVDLILLDIRMPGIDGWEVLRRVRADPEHRHTPVIMMSAHSSGHTRAEAKRAGCDDYVVKPFKEGDLTATVAELIARR